MVSTRYDLRPRSKRTVQGNNSSSSLRDKDKIQTSLAEKDAPIASKDKEIERLRRKVTDMSAKISSDKKIINRLQRNIHTLKKANDKKTRIAAEKDVALKSVQNEFSQFKNEAFALAGKHRRLEADSAMYKNIFDTSYAGMMMKKKAQDARLPPDARMQASLEAQRLEESEIQQAREITTNIQIVPIMLLNSKNLPKITARVLRRSW